ncbi:MAG: DUF790 family protein [Myxococcota bacterium]
MLTKDLLVFTTRKGAVKPTFIAAKGRETEVAEALVHRIDGALGEARGTLEADLQAQANQAERPRIAKGLVKLLLDRATFEEPDPEAQASRARMLCDADEVRRSLGPDASFEDFEAALASRFDVETARAGLYSDLPHRRPMTAFKAIDAAGLLARYDLAQVQGLLLQADRLTLEAADGDTPELRRLLRWMRFCRLVADVQVAEPSWRLVIEGPAAVLEGAKRYGLQLASFFAVVPTLERWRVTAQIKMSRRSPLELEVSHEAGLRGTFAGGAGHVPPEMLKVVEGWTDEEWSLDANPAPRPVGVRGWCVPDLAATRRSHAVCIELFHPWHHRALPARLAELEARPQPELLLGVDRKLAKKLQLDVEGPQIFDFSGFPSNRGLRKALKQWWSAFGEGR